MKKEIFLGLFPPVGGFSHAAFGAAIEEVRIFVSRHPGLIARLVVFPRGETISPEERGERFGGPTHEVTASMLVAREVGRTFPIHVESWIIRGNDVDASLKEARSYAEAQGAGGIVAWFPATTLLETEDVLRHVYNHHRNGHTDVTLLGEEMMV